MITIIGGGIQGVTIALKLIDEKVTTTKNLRIIDPNPYCHQWMSITNKIEMEYLRSTSVHHVHPNPFHLKQYAKLNQYAQGFSGYYKRPQLEMFNTHIHDQIQSYQLEDCHIYDKAVALHKVGDIYHIQGEHDVYETEQVIVATGMIHVHHIPDFMKAVDHHRYTHVFDYNQPLDSTIDVVIGGGITAAHTVRKLTKTHPVTLIMRHDIRVHELDADGGWLGPKNAPLLKNAKNYTERRQIITEARHSGSMPMHLKQSLLHLQQNNLLTIIKNDIQSVNASYIQTTNKNIPYNKIALTTGCSKQLKDDPFLKQIIEQFNPNIAPCGYPIVKPTLEWFDNVFVAGPLAELELGPMSRNIIGGRKASQIIAASIA